MKNIVSAVVVGVLLLGTCSAQTNQTSSQCLIVKQNKGHRVRNGFLFGVAGLAFSKGERFEYVDAVNFPNSRLKYKGGELQKLKDTGVHIIVVAEGAGEEVQSARASCRADVIPFDAKPTASKKVVSGNAFIGSPNAGYGILESADEWPCTISASAFSQSSTA